MKQVMSFFAGVFVSASAFYFTACEQKTKQNPIPTTVKTEDSLRIEGIDDMLVDSATATKYIRNYQAEHDTGTDRKITYSIFFGRDAISYMGNYFDSAGKNVIGVRIFNIQYNDSLIPSQRDKKQQAILFVPEDFRGNLLWNDWEKSTDSVSLKKFVDGFNHGELCPNRCP